MVTSKSRGFAFIEFRDYRDAQEACDALDRYEIDGREIGVVFAQEKRKTSDEMRGRCCAYVRLIFDFKFT